MTACPRGARRGNGRRHGRTGATRARGCGFDLEHLAWPLTPFDYIRKARRAWQAATSANTARTGGNGDLVPFTMAADGPLAMDIRDLGFLSYVVYAETSQDVDE